MIRQAAIDRLLSKAANSVPASYKDRCSGTSLAADWNEGPTCCAPVGALERGARSTLQMSLLNAITMSLLTFW